MKYQMLALDMDGTTLDSKKQIPREIVEGIDGLLDKGIHVVLSTGRGLAELLDYKEALKGMHYGILISGGMIYDFWKDEPVWFKPLPTDDVLRIIEAGDEEGAMVHMLTIRNSLVREPDIANMKDFSMEVYQDMYERVCDCDDDLAGFARGHDGEVLKVNLYHRSKESMERNFERLKDLDLTLVHAEETGLEASPSGITKGSGLERLCDYLRIPIENTVVVGDAPNDIEILKRAGLSVAMGNAFDEVKEICDVVVSDNDHYGVLEVIQRYF